MSTKRIILITVFGVLLIVAVIGVMLLSSFLRRDNDTVQLPVAAPPIERPKEHEPDAVDSVEVTRDTIQAVISTLSRPSTYSRDVVVENFWSGGRAEYIINVYVKNGITSLRTTTPLGIDKRIVVTNDTLYIWYRGDRDFYAGIIDSTGDEHRKADEWQMLVTFEDILELDKNYIVDAGYTEYEGEDCVYAVYLSPLLGYSRTYYVSLEIGLVIAAEEYDETGELIYSMTAGESFVGDIDSAMFTLPDGTELLAAAQVES